MPRRRRLNYANVTATLALVFSMSSGALAAKHYLINSTNQISPKVLKKLKGKTGRKGATGAVGREGSQGRAGPQGNEGKVGPAGTPATKLFAVVSSAGALDHGSGALSAKKEGAGLYAVQFNQNITRCAFLGTVGTVGFGGEEPGDIDVAGSIGTTDTVFVETHSNAGALENKSFHLGVLC